MHPKAVTNLKNGTFNEVSDPQELCLSKLGPDITLLRSFRRV